MKLLKVMNGLLISSFVLIVGAVCPAEAGKLVDLDKTHRHPLGELLESRTGDQVYFSLGNGRAIRLSREESVKKTLVLMDNIVLRRAGRRQRPRLVRRRNLKW